MKNSIYKFLSSTAFIFLVFSSVSSAQVTSSQSSNGTVTPDVTKSQDAVRIILNQAGDHFKTGLEAYRENKKSAAGESFNKSVEVFLTSTLNVQSGQKLKDCYDQLIETVYRLEFPSNTQLPQIKNLSQTCGWSNIDDALSVAVTNVANGTIANQASPNSNTVAVSGPSDQQKNGFG